MHELTITKTLIDLIISECKKEGIENPKKIITELGALTAYKKDQILFYYELLKKESPYTLNAELIIKETHGKIECNKCKKESVVKDALTIFCPACNCCDVSIIHGREFIVKEIKK